MSAGLTICIYSTPINRFSIGVVDSMPRTALRSAVGAPRSYPATLETGNKPRREATGPIDLTASLEIRFKPVK